MVLTETLVIVDGRVKISLCLWEEGGAVEESAAHFIELHLRFTFINSYTVNPLLAERLVLGELMI